jgi:hypothetical protein
MIGRKSLAKIFKRYCEYKDAYNDAVNPEAKRYFSSVMWTLSYRANRPQRKEK